MKLQNYKDSYNNINNNIDDKYNSSASKEINEDMKNYYLIKYRNLYGNSFNDQELMDIFMKNNYNDEQIKVDIKAILKINDSKKLDFSENKDDHYSPSFGQNSKPKNKKINRENIKKKIYFNSPKNEKYKEKENNSQKDTEVPSDYAPPPKHDEIRNINSINNNNQNINDILLEYKKEMFNKLKNQNYSYKSTKSREDELNYDNIAKCRTEKNVKKNYEKEIMDINKNINRINKNVIKNNSPGPECIPLKNKRINNNQDINKDLKKKYIKQFFGNMKNYNNIRTNNPGKSPDITKRSNILNSSPDKVEYYEKKIYTYKPGAKKIMTKKKTPYNSLEINSKVNDICISSCYDNPQRDQILKMINQKKKQNPDKIVEVLFTQFPTPLPFYPDMYQPYNQYNPYMNMCVMPTPQNYPIQTPMIQTPFNNNQMQNYDNNINQNTKGTNNLNNHAVVTNAGNLSDTQNSLTNSQLNHMNNITSNSNYNLNNNNNNINNLIPNNIAIDNLNNKSIGNLSNSGNINTSSSFK